MADAYGNNQPAPSTTRQISRAKQAAEERYAAKAARRGQAGTAKAVEPTRVTPPPTDWDRAVMVTSATKIANEAGRYTGKFFNWKVDPAATGNLAIANLGTADGDCEIWHAPDMACGTWTLDNKAIVRGVLAPQPHATRGKPIVVTLPATVPSGVIYVTLATTSGATGGTGSPPTFVYSAKNAAGDVIATALSPTAGRENGNFAAATKGLAYFDYAAGHLVLLHAFETRITGACS